MRYHRSADKTFGGLAQLGERSTGSAEVTGSSPVSSTSTHLRERRKDLPAALFLMGRSGLAPATL